MAQFPAFPLWTDAYLGDTSHLTTIEHGAYLLLLVAMWRNDGWLPNDDQRLMRTARLTKVQWSRIKPVFWGFFDVTQENITQGRLTDELNRVRQNSKRQSDKAKSRWTDKPLKEKDVGHAAAVPGDSTGNAGAMPPISISITRPTQAPPPPKSLRSFANSHTVEGDAGSGGAGGGTAGPHHGITDNDRLRYLEAIGLDASGRTGTGGRILGTPADMAVAQKWTDQLGLSTDDQLAVIRDVMATMRDGPPSSFHYFGCPMQRFATERNSPLPPPEETRIEPTKPYPAVRARIPEGYEDP